MQITCSLLGASRRDSHLFKRRNDAAKRGKRFYILTCVLVCGRETAVFSQQYNVLNNWTQLHSWKTMGKENKNMSQHIDYEIHTHIRLNTYTHMNTHTHTHIHTHTHTHHTHKHTHTHTHIYIYIYIYILYIRTHTQTYFFYTHMNMHNLIYGYANIYTHIHT